MAEMLRDENYATFAVGKWHLNPSETCSQAGPFHDWPLQRGFDRYYGFLSGETDQFYPDLVYDNHLIEPPRTPEEGYHFTEDIVDQATGFLRDHQSIYPEPAVLPLLRAGRDALAAPGPGRLHRALSGQCLIRVGTRCARSGSRGSSSWA